MPLGASRSPLVIPITVPVPHPVPQNESFTLQTGLTRGRCLLASFHWHLDRFAHTIGLLEDERLIPVLASHEGAPQDDWPLSPAFQEASLETGSGGSQCVLLVGMAGTSHWSASVEADPSAAVLHYDIACRINRAPSKLGSRYRSMTLAELTHPQQVQIKIADSVVLLHAEELGDFRFQVAPTENGVDVRATPITDDFPQTVRWKYSVRLWS